MMNYLAGPYTAMTKEAHDFNVGRLFSYFVWMNLNISGAIVCPPLSTAGFDFGSNELARRNYLSDCLRIIHNAQNIYFIPGWKNSEGSIEEFYKAYDVGLSIYYLKDFIDEEKEFLLSHLETLKFYNQHAQKAIAYLSS